MGCCCICFISFLFASFDAESATFDHTPSVGNSKGPKHSMTRMWL